MPNFISQDKGNEYKLIVMYNEQRIIIPVRSEYTIKQIKNKLIPYLDKIGLDLYYENISLMNSTAVLHDDWIYKDVRPNREFYIEILQSDSWEDKCKFKKLLLDLEWDLSLYDDYIPIKGNHRIISDYYD